MTALKQNNELSSKTEEDEEELERLTEKNRQLLKEVLLHQAGVRAAERNSCDVLRYSVGRFGSSPFRTAWHVFGWSCGLVVALYGMVWCGILWHGMYGMVWYDYRKQTAHLLVL